MKLRFRTVAVTLVSLLAPIVALAANPSISSLTPNSGAVGASITIAGANFGSTQGTSTVKFNGTAATSITSWSATSIVAKVPTAATTGNVVVTVSNHASNGVSFTVLPTPSISSLSPTSGAVGASVTITGSNFGSTQGSGTVKFNGTTAAVTSWNATSIVVTVPSGATTGNVVVHASGVDSNGSSFTVLGTPTITSLSPTSGAIGTAITITGSNFGSTQGSSTVNFNGTTASPTSWSATSIVVPVPSGASTGNVVVHASGVDSNGVSFTVAPAITSLSPASGAIGASVTISGTSFGTFQGNSTVAFNGTAAYASTWSDTSIVATVPSGATSGNVVITVGGLASNGVSFTVVPPPNVTGISPGTAAQGTSVTISGANFGATQGSGTLKFNGVAASPTSWNATTIVTPVPSGATTGNVVVHASGVDSNGFAFTVIPPPSISTLSPTSGPVNTSVTITGSNFGSPRGTGTITFNGTAASPTSWGDTSIIAPVPAGSTTGPVVVTAAGGPSAGVTFTVLGAPNISGLSPSTGALGSSVTISGTNFGNTQGNSVVRFNGSAATVTSWSNASIVAKVPNSATTGPVVVTVSNQNSNGVTFTAVTTGSVSGTITRSSDGSAVNGATIQALQAGAVKGSATSASNGTYSISNLTQGNYDIKIAGTGLGTSLHSSFAITAGQTSTLNDSLTSPSTISGTVTQADGITAISGASVQVLVGGTVAATATTDSGGNYSNGGLQAGSYTVQASASGFVARSQTVSAAAGSTATQNFSLQAAGTNPISYVYDELGRLIAVTDTSGDTAIYQYDAVGNILSISRQSSSQVAIISFSPRNGPVGTTVTINGTGFSSNAAQDTVKFNGTPASITSASATQIIVTVPSGATTGPISVTAPGGTATSSTNFTMGSAPGTPTITSFSPTMGTPGTAVTVTGTNFDLTPANDRLKFNLTAASTTTATATTLTTASPDATASGRLSISTPAGKATSSQDFFVPMSGYQTSDIVFTGRVTYGNSITVTSNSSANKIALVLFDATAGQRISVQISGSTFTSCVMNVIDPRNVQIGGVGSCSANLDNTALYETGTYTLGFVLGGAGSVNVTLTNASDIVVPITANGPSVTVTTTSPGQHARMTFNGTVNQNISVNASTTVTGSTLHVVKPDGADLYYAGVGFFDAMTLPETGPYSLLFTPPPTTPGSATVNLYTFTDVTAPISPVGANGPYQTVTTTTPGQNARLTFTGSPNQHVSVSMQSCPYTYPSYTQISILKPDGTTLGNTSTLCPANLFFDPPLLPVAGTYAVYVDLPGAMTGDTILRLNDATDATGTISQNGQPVSATTTVPGQDARLTFSGTAGERVSAYSTGTIGGYLHILSPTGVDLSYTSLNVFLDVVTLPATGTYTVWVDGFNGSVGTEQVTLWDVPADPTGTIQQNGSAVTVTTTAPGQNGSLTFSGTTGEKVSVTASATLSGGSYPTTTYVYLRKSDGTTVASASMNPGTTSTFIDPTTLPANDTYTLYVDPGGTTTGSVTLNLYDVSDVIGAITPNGSSVPVTISTPGQNALLTFSGTAGQSVTANLTGNTISFVGIVILKPDGTTLTSTSFGGASGSLNSGTLPTTGTYTLKIDPSGAATGSVTAAMTQP